MKILHRRGDTNKMLSLVRTSDTERKSLRSSCSIGERCSSVREGRPANGTRGCSIITKIGQYMRRLKRRLVVGCMWEEKKRERERENEKYGQIIDRYRAAFICPIEDELWYCERVSLKIKRNKKWATAARKFRGGLLAFISSLVSSLSALREPFRNPPLREFFYLNRRLERFCWNFGIWGSRGCTIRECGTRRRRIGD